jgi:hypothetical protein
VETMTTVVTGVQANSPAPLFRVVGGAVVSSCRPVIRLAGREYSGFSAAVSGLHGYAGQDQVERSLVEQSQVELGQVQQLQAEQGHALLAQGGRREVLLAQTGGFNGNDGIFSDNDGSNGSTDGSTGSKPMSPWGYRTSSPPG